MKKSLLILSVLFVCLATFAGIEANASIDFDGKTLDTGIYWYGKGNVAEKFIEGKQNPYFNPNKPTMILLHGWQNNSTKNLYRISFNTIDNNKSLNMNILLADYWINKGWNIGIFYWNQFGDEGEVKNAEAKVWSNASSVGLRWRKYDESYERYTGSEKSVAEIFLENYIKAMKSYNGSEIRLVGHSLGAQLNINSTKLIEDAITSGRISSRLRPNRVALLDPFFSKGEKNYLGGRWPGEICREYVKEFKQKGIVVEEYKSSNMNDLLIGDSNTELKKMVVYTEIYPDFTGLVNQQAKHCYGKEWYIYSQGFNAPSEYLNGLLTGNVAPSASTPTWLMKQMCDTGYYWTQRDGKNSSTPEDDIFNKVKW